MDIEFLEVPFIEIRTQLIESLQSYSSPVDSYYEDHVIESKHYRIHCDRQAVGYASIFEDSMLTQFALAPSKKALGAEVFQFLIQQKALKEAYLSTADAFFLCCALDQQQSVSVQDWVFQAAQEIPQTIPGFSLTQARTDDHDLIRQKDEGFFQNLPGNLQKGEIVVGRMNGQVVSFGILEKSKLLAEQASLGIFVVKEQRGKHYGSETIRGLIHVCRMKQIMPVAGCFARNEYSRNALLRAGMFSSARLLKVKFSPEIR